MAQNLKVGHFLESSVPFLRFLHPFCKVGKVDFLQIFLSDLSNCFSLGLLCHIFVCFKSIDAAVVITRDLCVTAERNTCKKLTFQTLQNGRRNLTKRKEALFLGLGAFFLLPKPFSENSRTADSKTIPFLSFQPFLAEKMALEVKKNAI